MTGSGDGERALLQSLDYPCTKRLRLRRLLAYHRRHTYEEVYNAMKKRTRLIFEAKLVRTGQWRAARSYVVGFVPSDPMSDEATLLLLFLQDLMALSDFADGVTIMACLLSDWFLSIYKEPALEEYPCFAILVADVLFLRSDHARDFLNWQLVRNKAAEMVEEMVYKTPELKDKLHFPRGPHNLHHVVPIRSSFHRGRHAKIVCRKQSTDYAQFYLRMKKRLPSSTQTASPDCSAAGSGRISGELRMALLDKLVGDRCSRGKSLNTHPMKVSHLYGCYLDPHSCPTSWAAQYINLNIHQKVPHNVLWPWSLKKLTEVLRRSSWHKFWTRLRSG